MIRIWLALTDFFCRQTIGERLARELARHTQDYRATRLRTWATVHGVDYLVTVEKNTRLTPTSS